MKVRGKVEERRPGTGRPCKFDEPSRPVTVTLPERTLGDLALLDPDRARAIVRAAETAVGGVKSEGRPVEVIEVAPDAAVIVVGASRALARVPGLRLVSIAAGRHLITLDPGTAIESLEIAIVDILDALDSREESERELLSALLQEIRGRRRAAGIRKAEILFVQPAARGRQRSAERDRPHAVQGAR